MKKIGIGFTVFWLLNIVFLNCKPESADFNFGNIELEEVLSIGDLDSDDLYMWSGVTVDKRDNIFVTDMMDYSVKKFDRTGRLVKKSGKKGQGPGEFSAPLAVASSDRYLYILDQYKKGIHVFDFDLNFLRLVPCQWPVFEFKVLENETIAVIPVTAKPAGKIYYLNTDGMIIGETPYLHLKSMDIFMDQVNLAVGENGDVYLAFYYRDLICRQSSSGDLIWEKSLFGGISSEQKEIQGLKVPETMVYKSICLDERGLVYLLVAGEVGNFSRRVFVLDPDGEFKTSFDLPESSHMIYIDHQNYLYARANDGVTLKKYRIQLEDVL